MIGNNLTMMTEIEYEFKKNGMNIK